MTSNQTATERRGPKATKIGLVELYATGDGRLFSPRIKDLYSVVKLPSRAVDLLAAILRANGYDSVKTRNPLYDSPRGRFSEDGLVELAGMDVVGISSITRTQPQSYELASRLKQLNPRLRIIFGGPHVTALPEEALQHGDIVVGHEGDATIVELMDRLDENPMDPSLGDVAGIAYRGRDGEILQNQKRPFLTSEELSALPFPVFPQNVVKSMNYSVIVTSRGCPFSCEFCSVIFNFGSQYRFLDVDRTVALIEHTLRQTRKPIFFGDDNFDARPSRTRAVLEKILEKGISMPPWGAQVRVESSEDRELLSLMRRAGCNKVYVGFESVNDKTLAAFNKRSSLEKNETALSRFHEAGISVHGMFVLGSDEDSAETVDDSLRFAKRMKLDTAQFFTLMAIPGTALRERYGMDGKILTNDWHLYDGHHVVVRPQKIPPHVLQEKIMKAHLSFYSWKEALRCLIHSNDRTGNATLRILGNSLTREILRDSLPYQRNLEALDRWTSEVETLYQRARGKWGSITQEVREGWTRRTEPVRISLEEFARGLKSSLESVSAEFLPYCSRHANLILERATAQLGIDDPALDSLSEAQPLPQA